MNTARADVKPLSVQAAPYKVPDPSVVESALAGAREELSGSGLLAATGAFPQLWLEIVRVDEAATGIAAVPPTPGANEIPLARGARIGVTGRAWVVDAIRSTPAYDTGDVRRTESVGAADDLVSDALHRDAAARAAARDLGRTLARAVLGEPAAPNEPL